MAHRELTHVPQSTTTSCGPASVAIIARCSEAEAIRAIFGDDHEGDFKTLYPDVKKGFDSLGIKYAKRAKRVASWAKIRSVSIVACSRLQNRSFHFVVFDPTRGGGLVYDPWHKAARPLSRVRRRPFSYLEVRPAP